MRTAEDRPRRWVKDKSYGYVCTGCQEPVGPPWWAGGCACDGPLNSRQKGILELMERAWDKMRGYKPARKGGNASDGS